VIQATSNIYVGSHTIIVEASIPGGNSFLIEILVIVEPDCNFSTLSGGEPSDVVRYDIS